MAKYGIIYVIQNGHPEERHLNTGHLQINSLQST
jgi:hypothetical protein